MDKVINLRITGQDLRILCEHALGHACSFDGEQLAGLLLDALDSAKNQETIDLVF